MLPVPHGWLLSQGWRMGFPWKPPGPHLLLKQSALDLGPFEVRGHAGCLGFSLQQGVGASCG